MVNEKRRVGFGFNKSQGPQVGGEATIPYPWGLFKSVEGLVEAADIIRMRGIDEASGLRTLDRLSESPVKKSIVDVELMHGPITRESNTEDYVNSGRLDDRAESLIIVDTRTLGEAAKNPACLVSIKRPIRVKLVFEYPFVGDDIGKRRPADEGPGVVSDQSLELILHSMPPVGIVESVAIRGRDRQ
jgi:hypothetical protein